MIYLEPRITVVARPVFTEPSHLAVNWIGDSTDGERLAEFAGRLCYMSQRNPASRSTRDYLENIKKQGHGSVLEHACYSLLLEGVSRSLTHELVRHRAGFAYSQLSQRYVDESEANFVMPPAIIGNEILETAWRAQMDAAQAAYGKRPCVADDARAEIERRRRDGDQALRRRDPQTSPGRSSWIFLGLRDLSGGGSL